MFRETHVCHLAAADGAHDTDVPLSTSVLWTCARCERLHSARFLPGSKPVKPSPPISRPGATASDMRICYIIKCQMTSASCSRWVVSFSWVIIPLEDAILGQANCLQVLTRHQLWQSTTMGNFKAHMTTRRAPIKPIHLSRHGCINLFSISQDCSCEVCFSAYQ